MQKSYLDNGKKITTIKHIKKIDVSIVIVHYHVKKEILACIQSIIEKTTDINYEIIVVDNDEIKTLQKDLYKKFPNVIYVPNQDKGFGEGNNVGVKYASGKYIFFLNPDTTIYQGSISKLVAYLRRNKNVGIVAPILLHPDLTPFELQGVSTLTPIRGMIALSFINKFFPNNPISKKYWQYGWDKTKVKEVDVVPGTAFMIRKDLYEKVGGFDENFFLYFEEFDLCKRIKEKGYRLYMIPSVKIIHLWGKSTAQTNNINIIFQKSRFYYFRKHYGLLFAILVEIFTRMGKEHLLLLAILFVSSMLLFYKFSTLMVFIGDQGWFYLSARDLLLGKEFPLVGIPSSHPWLHQGAYWTYLLAIALSIGRFHPLAGGYIGILFGVLGVSAVYWVAKSFFTKRTALIATILYATSPLVVAHARMPYHTTPIPFFTTLYIYSLLQWIKGKVIFFPISLSLLAILYNFEIATVLLVFPFLLIAAYGLIKKTKWFIPILNKKIIFTSVGAIILPMIPMLLYDLGHGFPQTFKFIAWLAYRILVLLGYPPLHPEILSPSREFFYSFSFDKLTYYLFPSNTYLAILIFLSIIIGSTFYIIKSLFESKINTSFLIIYLITICSLLGYVINQTPSEAYLPILFSPFMIMAGFLVNIILDKKGFMYPTLTVISIIVITNIIFIWKVHSIENQAGITFRERMEVVEKIIKKIGKSPYSLHAIGEGSQFESFLDNYRYLLWWKKHPPLSDPQKIQVILKEEKDIIKIIYKGIKE
jgi:hypothetical protein